MSAVVCPVVVRYVVYVVCRVVRLAVWVSARTVAGLSGCVRRVVANLSCPGTCGLAGLAGIRFVRSPGLKSATSSRGRADKALNF